MKKGDMKKLRKDIFMTTYDLQYIMNESGLHIEVRFLINVV